MVFLFRIFYKYTFIFLAVFGAVCLSTKIRYVSTEHPKVTYFNPKYVSYAEFTSQRYGRDDPVYYMGGRGYSLGPVNYNVSADLYFWQFLTNKYKPSFVELHINLCDMVQKKFLGMNMANAGIFAKPCPFPPGEIILNNITIPVSKVPKSLPFTKGRIFANFTSTDTRELVISGQIDLEIKEFIVRKKKN